MLTGFGFVFVTGLGADQALHLQAFGGHGFFHHVAGLFLAVDLAGVGDGGEHGEVGGVVGAVVHVPEGFLPRFHRVHFFGLDVEELA